VAEISPQDVLNKPLRSQQVGIWWLGLAGFLLRAAEGPVIAIDPYLSDSCALSHGLSRKIPVPMDPADLSADLILATHWHPDHLDPETIRPQRDRQDVYIAGPYSCIRKCRAWGIPEKRLHQLSWGESLNFHGVVVRAVVARHMNPGSLAEDACGYLVNTGPLRVYHTGDTEYDVRLRGLEHQGIDVMLACFTGIGQTLDAQEAAWLASRVKPRWLIPMHFGMFDYSGYSATIDDPAQLVRVYGCLVDEPRVIVPQVGNPIVLDR
jgi:L-ascorbate 6-phosphate lactonase